MNYINTKTERRSHADLIIEWANNTKIMIQAWDISESCWKDIESPIWNPRCVYRIKPEPIPEVVVYTCIGKTQGFYHSLGCWSIETLQKDDRFNFSFESGGVKYKVVTKLKLTYDGETGKLKEVVEI